MNERALFVAACNQGLFSVSELCRNYGISRKTAYKWLHRWKEEGLDGLRERSRAPHSCPHRMAEEIAEAIVSARKSHPTWGPRKLLVHLASRQPDLADRLPAPSSAGYLLMQRGLVEPRARRTPRNPAVNTPLVAEVPNAVWCVDFKGEFLTGDSRLCYPLTMTDACTRYLLACDALSCTRLEYARPVFERVFVDCGLPEAIRSDNGKPFSGPGLGNLSRLSVWWMRLGIQVQRIARGKPQQNGRHERMHRTLKAETTRPPEQDQALQQKRFDRFREEYNTLRPHEALEMRTPASLWTPSLRALPATTPEPEYPGHMVVRSIHNRGCLQFAGKYVFLSDALRGEHVGLEEVDDGLWSIYFCNTLLARLEQRSMRLVGADPMVYDARKRSTVMSRQE